MSTIILGLALTGMAALSARWLERSILQHADDAGMWVNNRYGEAVACSGGILIFFSTLPGFLLLATFQVALEYLGPLLLLQSGFVMLGMYDDLAGRKEGKGWGFHLHSIVRGIPSAGAIKLIGGGCLAFIATRWLSTPYESHGWIQLILAATLIALSGSFFNLLDTAPGRSATFALFLLVLGPGVGMLYGRVEALAWMPLLGALLAYRGKDAACRMMLGDAGAFLLGVSLGAWFVLNTDFLVQLTICLGLIVVHWVADRISIGHLLDALVRKGA